MLRRVQLLRPLVAPVHWRAASQRMRFLPSGCQPLRCFSEAAEKETEGEGEEADMEPDADPAVLAKKGHTYACII